MVSNIVIVKNNADILGESPRNGLLFSRHWQQNVVTVVLEASARHDLGVITVFFTGNKTYEEWIRTFYEGSLIVPGWDTVSRDVLENTPIEQRETIRERLLVLGERISREWAKDNESRRIDSTHLHRWGRILKSRQQRGYETLAAELEMIETEVDRLLSTAIVHNNEETR